MAAATPMAGAPRITMSLMARRHLARVAAADVDLALGKQALVDHHDGVVLEGDGGEQEVLREIPMLASSTARHDLRRSRPRDRARTRAPAARRGGAPRGGRWAVSWPKTWPATWISRPSIARPWTASPCAARTPPSAPVTLSVVGQVRAGQWPERSVAAGEAVEIMTGAPAASGSRCRAAGREDRAGSRRAGSRSWRRWNPARTSRPAAPRSAPATACSRAASGSIPPRWRCWPRSARRR